MKLRMVPARTGVRWVRLGFRTFFNQPLALSGLFFLLLASSMSLAGVLPVVGKVLALALLPAATLGLMVATEEADKGQFPLPTVLLSAFNAGRQRLRSMWILGALYAASSLLILAITTLVDGGKFATLVLMGGTLTPELVLAPGFVMANLIAAALYIPLSLLFWHAPALVHWYGITPAKSLFFSWIACLRNVGAFTIFGLVWMGVYFGIAMALSIVGFMLGNVALVPVLMLPVGMLLAAIFLTSIYFTFRDSFEPATGDPL